MRKHCHWGRVVLIVADARVNALDREAHSSPEVCSPKKSVQNSGSMLLHLGSQSNVTPVIFACECVLVFTAMKLVTLCLNDVLLNIIRAYLYTPEEVLLLCTCEALFFLDYSFLADARYNFHIYNVWQSQLEEEEYYRSLSISNHLSDSDPDTD